MLNNLKAVLLGIFALTANLAMAIVPPAMPPGSDVSAKMQQQILAAYQQKSGQFEHQGIGQQFVNRLILESSPYLLRHATNPIDWRPWSADAFELAKAQDKPVFLSIGYSTCHWCHVMEQDSFVKTDIAELINRDYIAVKVDRETHPAVDELYTSALNIVVGSSGWPVTAILNPQGQPLFIDSFLTNQKLKVLLPRMAKMWRSSPELLNQNAAQIMALVAQQQSVTDVVDWQKDSLHQTLKKTIEILDTKQGGFTGSPKFPQETQVLFLLDQYQRAPSESLAAALKLQLDNMAKRGMYDHIHGGFHRYSTDDKWLIPHYEKMLYNQGQLLLAYSRAADIFNDDEYLLVVEDVVRFLKQWLYNSEQGLYSAVDAVYNNQDGGFYLYSVLELQGIDRKNRKAAGMQTYAFGQSGLFGVYFDNPFLSQAKSIKAKLSKLKKPRPHIDRKIITSWNALAIWGLIEAYQVSGNTEYQQLATTLLQQIWAGHFARQQLYRSAINGEVQGEGTLEDYAFLTRALLAMYDLDENKLYLQRAQTLTKLALAKFSDDQLGLVFSEQSELASKLSKTRDSEQLPAYGVMVENLQLLWLRSGDVMFKKQRKRLSAKLKGKITGEPLNHLYSALVVANIDDGAVNRKQYFANGLASVRFKSADSCQQHLQIKLADGWHINSDKPLQKHLRATRLDVPGVVYPKAKVMNLGFQQQPLSLFEGAFELLIYTQQPQFTLEVQACSDKVCLLPQKLNFYNRGCR